MLTRFLTSAAALALTAGTAAADYSLTILHTNDFHDRFEPISKYDSTCAEEDNAAGECFGGIARLVTAIGEARSAAPGDVLLLIDGMQGSVSSIDVARDLIRGVEGTTVTLQVLRGITQHEFGPMRRAAWVTMQQVYASSACVFPPFIPFPECVRLSG